MILKRFYDDKLAQASYLVGCGASGEACIVDPNRDIEQYLRGAEKEGVRIVAVTETHIHADYLSGARELAKAAGARLFLSKEGGEDWQYAFAQSDGATLIGGGDCLRVGAVRMDVIKTPGHTPEHLTFIITDEAGSNSPMAALTGDFVFVGDVGRPDLLERAANIQGTMERGAMDLFDSVQSFKQSYPEFLLLMPGHGAGSACGKNLGAVPVSTLGYEKTSNWAFGATNKERFVAEVVQGQPDPPKYFAEMKKRNREGPALLGKVGPVHKLSDAAALRRALTNGDTVVDIRPSEEVALGYLRGCLHIPQYNSFTTWAGWFLTYDKPIILIALSQARAEEAARDLRMIGLDEIVGWYSPDALRELDDLVATIPEVDASALEDPGATILDVRTKSEFEEGHVPGALHIPLGRLPERISEVPKGRVLVHCHSGSRSIIAATYLKNAGYDVTNVPDGLFGYERLGLPIEAGALSAVG
jgi:hydroxyacylglutathione hydrolase